MPNYLFSKKNIQEILGNFLKSAYFFSRKIKNFKLKNFFLPIYR